MSHLFLGKSGTKTSFALSSARRSIIVITKVAVIPPPALEVTGITKAHATNLANTLVGNILRTALHPTTAPKVVPNRNDLLNDFSK